MSVGTWELQPLLQALRDLCDAYGESLLRVENLIAALACGSFVAVQSAVAAQTAAVAVIEAAELRRQAAEADLVAAVHPSDEDGAPGEAFRLSALLELLPSSQAAELRQARHDLLSTMVRAQAANRQAAVLIHGAQAVINRLAGGMLPQTIGYGPHGEVARPRADIHRQPARLA